MVHEVPDQSSFFNEIRKALKSGGKLLIVEPKGHVYQAQFGQTVAIAEEIGLKSEVLPHKVGGRGALLNKQE